MSARVNQVPCRTTASIESPVSPADLQRQLHDDAEAILSDFRENLSRSMTLRDSATTRPSTDGHGSITGPQLARSKTTAGAAGFGATPPISEAAALGSETSRDQGSFPQREPSLWFAAAEPAATEPQRNVSRNDASADARARGPQRRLNWDEESPALSVQPPQAHAAAGADLLAPSSQHSQQHTQQHFQQRESGPFGRDGTGSTGKRTPLIVPKRLNLVMPTAAFTPASADADSQPRHALDTTGKSTGQRSSSGAGLLNTFAAQPQQQRTTPSGQWPLQSQRADQLHHPANTIGLELAALLADNNSPLTLPTPYALQSPADGAATSPAPGHANAGFDFQPPRDHPQAVWSGQTDGGPQQRGAPPDDGDEGFHESSATPPSRHIQQVPGDARYRSSGDGVEQGSFSPHAEQLTPPLVPEASATPEWMSGGGGGRRSSASTRRTLPTPASEATFSQGRIGAAVTHIEAARTAWPGLAEQEEDEDDGDYGNGDSEHRFPLAGSGPGSPGRAREADVPVPAYLPRDGHPWMARSPGAGSGLGISEPRGSAASSPTMSAPQHTDLSNLLDTSPSGSVAFAPDPASEDDAQGAEGPAYDDGYDGDYAVSSGAVAGASEQVAGPAESGHIGRALALALAAVGEAEGFGRASAEGPSQEGQFSDIFQGEDDSSLYEPGCDSVGMARMQGRAAAALAQQPGRWAGAWISEESSFTGSLGAHTYNGGGGAGSDSEVNGAAAVPEEEEEEDRTEASDDEAQELERAGGVVPVEQRSSNGSAGARATAAALQDGVDVGVDARALKPPGGGGERESLRGAAARRPRSSRSRSRSRSSERESALLSQQSQLRAWRRVRQGDADDDDDELQDEDDGDDPGEEQHLGGAYGGNGNAMHDGAYVVDDGALSQPPRGGFSPRCGSNGGSIAADAGSEPSLGPVSRGGHGKDDEGGFAIPVLRNLAPSYEVSWTSETERELAGELSRAWGSTASRRETQESISGPASASPVAAAAAAAEAEDSPAAEPSAESSGAAAPAPLGPKTKTVVDVPYCSDHRADTEPPTDSLLEDTLPQRPGGASHSNSGSVAFAFSFSHHTGGAAPGYAGSSGGGVPAVLSSQASPCVTGGGGGAASAAAPATSAVVSDWSFADGKPILYDPNGYRSSCSSAEFCGMGVGAGLGSGLARQQQPQQQPDLTPRAHSAVKTIMSWQIQENPAFEEDLDAAGSASQLGDDPADQAHQLLSPLADQPSPLLAPGLISGGHHANAAVPQDHLAHHHQHHQHQHHQHHHDGLRVRAPPAGAADAAGGHGNDGGTAWTPTAAATDATTSSAITSVSFTAFTADGRQRTVGSRGGGAAASGSCSSSSSGSDTPRISALNRVLASGGFGTGGGSSGPRRPRPSQGARRGGALHHHHAAVEDDGDDRRDTASSSHHRTLGGSHGGSIAMGLAPAPGSCSRGAISAIADADDRSLILELEHTQALLLQALAAEGEQSLLTPPPPPSPAPAPALSGSAHHGALLVLRTTDDAAAAAEPMGTPMLTPAASSGSADGLLRASPCSGGSSGGGSGRTARGLGNPYVAQVATTVVGKALLRVVKLSRENQGLARVNEQLRSELSHSTSKHMELQTRSKMLHTMLAESGREAEKKAASQQRRFLRMEAHLSGCHQRIRELERTNTQLSLEGRQAARQLEAAQAQAAEAALAAGALRGHVAALETQLAAAAAAGEAERRLADALAVATEDASALRHRVAWLEERLGAAAAAGEAERRAAEALRGQLAELEGQLGASRVAVGEERRAAEVEAEALRAQVAALQGELAGAVAVAGEERCAEAAAAAELAARVEEVEAALAATRTAAGEEARGLAAVAEALRGQVAAMEEQLRAARDAADAERCRAEVEAATEVEQLLSACAEAEARAQQLEAMLRAAQGRAEQVPQLEAELAEARAEAERVRAEAEDAAAEAADAEAQLTAELQAARVAMAELAAERAAARAEALRKEDDAQKASLAAQEARGAAETAAGNYARVAAEAREAEARHEVAMAEAEVAAAELRRQLDAAAWEAQRLTGEATEAEARAEEAEAREREMLEQLRGAVEEAERARDEAQQAQAQVEAMKEAAADDAAAAVSELELALAAESARLLEEVQRRESAEGAALEQLRHMRTQLAAAQEAQRAAAAERDDLAVAHGAATEQLEALVSELGVARQELQSLRSERERLRSEQARLVAQAGEEAAALAATLQEAAVLRDRAAEAEALRLEAEARAAVTEQRLTAELVAAEAHARDAAARMAEAEAIHGSVAAELEAVRRELAEARDAAEEAQWRLEGAEQDKIAMAERLREVRAELEEQGVLARVRLDEEEGRTAAAEAALEDARREQLLLRDNLDNLAEDLAAARAALADREAALAAARGELEAAAAAAADAEGRSAAALAEVRARAASAEEAAEAERCRAADLEAEMQVAMRKLVELQKAAECREAAENEAKEKQTALATNATTNGGGGADPERYQRVLLCSAEELVAVSASVTSSASKGTAAPESRGASRRGSYHGGDARGSQPASQPDSPNLKLAGDVVAAHAELRDLRRRHDDAEELIGKLREELSRTRQRCEQLEGQLAGREEHLAAARRERQEAMGQMQELQMQLRESVVVGGGGGGGGGGGRPNPWRPQGGGTGGPVGSSAVFSSAAWSISSSLRVEPRASMVLLSSPSRSSMALTMRDSSAAYEQSTGFAWMQRAEGAFGTAAGAAAAAAAAAAASGGGGFAVSATPVSLWVEPGSVGEGRTIGTLATPFTEGASTPLGPLATSGHQGRYYGGDLHLAAAGGGGGGGGGAAAAYLREGAARSPDASISLVSRGHRAGRAGGLGGGGGGGGCYSADVSDILSPQARGFEPLRAAHLSHQLDGFRTSYGSVVGGAATAGSNSPMAGGPQQGLGPAAAGAAAGGSGAASVCGGGSGGMALSVQLLELRYAVQRVEQAAGELATVLLTKGHGAGPHALNAAAFSTPTKTSSGSAGGGGGGSCLRRSMAARPSDAAASEAALQERAWLADSLTNLTRRAGAVAAQLSSCLDAAAAMAEATAEGVASRASVAVEAEQGPGSGSGNRQSGSQSQSLPQQLLSPLAVRVLEAELADLRAQFQEAQRQAEEALQRQQAQHLSEVDALAADADQQRELVSRMREQLGALERAVQNERSGRREQDEEARSESQHRLALQLADRCREHEAVIAQLRRQLEMAAEAGAGEPPTTGREAAEAIGGGGGSNSGDSARYHGGYPPGGYGHNHVSQGGHADAVAVSGVMSTHRDYRGASSPLSIGETCASTQGGGSRGFGFVGGRAGGGGNSHGSCGSSCGDAGGVGYYGTAAAAAAAAAAGRPISPVVSAGVCGGGGFSAGGPSLRYMGPQHTPNSADAQQTSFHLDLVSADHHHYHQHPHSNTSSQRHLIHGLAARPAATTADSPAVTAGGAGGQSAGGRRQSRGGAGDGHEECALSEDEARLWLELVQLLKAAEGGGSHSRGASSGSGASAAAAAAAPQSLLALASAGDAAAGMQLAHHPTSSGGGSGGGGDLRSAAVSTRGRAELLARAVSHMSLLSAQNRKLGKLLKGVAGARAAAAAAAAPSAGTGGGAEGVAARLEAMQRENSELREKYQAALLAQKQSGLAMRKLGAENRQLHSQVMELMGVQLGALQARSASASAANSAATGAHDNDHDNCGGGATADSDLLLG
ncbi:hypothetical protein PLESTF_001755800 [Pleodorina starrii]|nr:hypothetical protein PLESTF_001755800 [Pleodorina starrii]